MAKRTGFTVRLNNSDNEQRKYDLSCEVSVSEQGVRSVESVNVSKDGQGVANIHFGNYSKDNPHVTISFHGPLPLAEHPECIAAAYAFVAQAIEEAGGESAE